MDRRTIMYAYLLSYLYAALSSSLFLAEKYGMNLELPSKPQHSPKNHAVNWYYKADELAEWLLDELFSPGFQKDSMSIASHLEDLADSFIFEWSDEMISAARHSQLRLPLTELAVCLYYYYCGALARIIEEFDKLFYELCSDAAQWSDHYNINRFRWISLSTILQHEKDVTDHEYIAEEQRKALRANIEEFAGQSGAKWRQIVLDATHQHS